MKTKKLVIAVTFIVITAIISCRPGVKNDDPVGMDTTKSYQIPLSDMITMVTKYKTERQEIINSNPELLKKYGDTFEDTRNIWFSLKELKQFINEVERKAKQNKLNVNMDGIRMYLSVYPEKDENESDYLRSVKEEYRNHTTLLLMPTYYDSVYKESVDFDPSHFNGNKPMNLKMLKTTDTVTTLQTQTVMNHGTLCPPMCPKFPSSPLK